jgi:hypothetical protein
MAVEEVQGELFLDLLVEEVGLVYLGQEAHQQLQQRGLRGPTMVLQEAQEQQPHLTPHRFKGVEQEQVGHQIHLGRLDITVDHRLLVLVREQVVADGLLLTS